MFFPSEVKYSMPKTFMKGILSFTRRDECLCVGWSFLTSEIYPILILLLTKTNRRFNWRIYVRKEMNCRKVITTCLYWSKKCTQRRGCIGRVWREAWHIRWCRNWRLLWECGHRPCYWLLEVLHCLPVNHGVECN